MEETFTKAIDILYLAKQQDVDIILNGDQLQLKIPENKTIDQGLLSIIRANKQLIIDFLSNDNLRSTSVSNNNHEITSFDRGVIQRIPLSFSQERLWFIDRLGGSVQYHLRTVLRLHGNLDRSALTKALQEIVNRHEILRTVYYEDEDGEVYQRVKETGNWTLEEINGSRYTNDPEGLENCILGLTLKPFNLDRDDMFRAGLIELDKEDHILAVTMHHIASDASSLPVLVREVATLYRDYVSAKDSSLPELPLQYADYAVWQRENVQGTFLEDKLAYWKKQLDDVSPIELPADYARRSDGVTRGSTVSFKIDADISQQVQALGQRHGATLYMTLLSAFNVLLSRYSGHEDICVGTSIAGRPQKELEGLIGFFVNTLALRSQVRGDMSFIELLQEVKGTTLAAYNHQEVPFEKVVETVVKERAAGISPLFQVMLVLNNTADAPELKLGELSLSAEGQEQTTTKFDLTFFIKETKDGFRGTVQYNTDLYSEERIERMAAHFRTLLESIVSSPQTAVGKLELLSGEEKNAISNFGQSQGAYPKEATVADLFEARAIATPDTIAVVYEEQQLSYRALNERSNQLAHYLRGKGVKEDTLVPLLIERGADMLIGILGILKAGGAYVPIDTDFPEERISYMLENTDAAVVVSSSTSSYKLPAGTDLEVIELDEERATLRQQPTEKPVTSLESKHLAYVIYTSGSTGKPKGVQISHQNLVDYVYGLEARTGISKCKSFALVSSIATDLGNTVLYGSLLFGGTLHLFSKETVSHIEALHEYFDTHSIDCLKIVPSHWKVLTMDGQPLLPQKLLVFGGEALQSTVAEQIGMTGTSCRVVNHYGPTETTIGKLLHEVEAGRRYDQVIPVGKPFSNTKTYVLSKELSLCPIGVPGQLYIAGEGLSRGYVKNEELTAEKFIQNPYGKAGEKMYGTGDRVQYLPDGNIVFIGRVDDQVKIRGYRVEPGEVGRILEESEQVEQAIVLAKEDKQGNKQLIGYIVPKGEYDRNGILSYLKEQLPDYMVPAHLVALDSFPLTANGKIDRKALPDPENTQAEGGYTAPRNETEQKLAAIWQDVLEIEEIGINDDFFEIGGHSLLAVRLVSAIRKTFGMELPIADVFDYPTVGQLATRLTGEQATELLPPVTAEERPEYIPLSFSQERLWFIDRLEGSAQYNLPSVLRLKGELDPELLEKTLRTIITRHEVLRTIIREHEGRGYQQIMPADNWSLGISRARETEDTNGYIAELVTKPFDFSNDYMLRADLIRLEDADHILVVTMHHIASDGWSRAILVKEVIALYESYTSGKAATLAALPVQYADYAIWQRKYMQGEVLDEKLNYWKRKLDDVGTLELPSDYSRPAIQRLRGAVLGFNISTELSSRVNTLGQQQGTTLYMTLLAAFKVLLYRYSGQEDICVGTTVAGRNQQDLEGLIGFFINTLALRSQVRGDMSFNTLLEEVKATTLEAYTHQEVPFEKVVDAVVKRRDMSRNPLFQVLFSLQNTPEIPKLNIGGLSLSAEGKEHDTSRFDIAFMVKETGAGIHVSLEYNTDLYSEERIERMAAHFRTLLESIVSSPQTAVGKLELLSGEEKNAISNFGQSQGAYPKEATVADLFEARAIATPDTIAVVYEEQQLSYRALNERSNQLAHYLRGKGVKEDTLVPLLIERGADMLIGILGILKAGGAYVPIDTDFPEERISYMLENTDAAVVVSSSTSSYKLPAGTDLEVIELDEERATLRQQPTEKPVTSLESKHLAYVIYTSGSTGKPKGVQISHQNLVDYVYGLEARTGISKCKSFALVSSIATDLGNTVLYGSLLFGGTLHLFSKETVSHIEALHEYFDTHSIDCLKIVPSHWKVLTMDGQPLLPQKLLVFGGEALQSTVAEQIGMTGTSCRVVNHYGPTETTIGKLLHEVEAGRRYDQVIPVGKPFSNTKTYVLSKELSLCPIGVPGQLYIAGEGLSRGYVKNEELTAEKFIQNPYGKAGEKMYGTGDRVQYLPDGNIVFIGRVDDQVKIRGYRVEPGEVGRILEESEQVEQAIVLAKEDKQGNKQLIGYIVPKGEYDRNGILSYLKEQLPDYMVPAHLVALDSFPLTANGKIDRKALPDPENTQAEGGYTAPRNETEQKLAAIWQDVLEIEEVGINDDFFEIGGHSLLAVRLVSAIRKTFGMELPIADVFDYPTVGQLATRLTGEQATELLPPVTAEERPEYIPLSFSQERLWFIDRLEGSIQYHTPTVLRLRGEINTGVLEDMLRTIVNRHQVLRSVLREHNGEAYQQIMPADSWALGIAEGSAYKENKAALSKYISNLIRKPFDLSTDYMMRADLISIDQDDHVLVVTFHHIASDGWSRSVLVRELLELYAAYDEKRTANLPELPVQYADYAIWQRKYLQGELLEEKISYWQTKLEGVAPLELPTDYVRPAIQSLRGSICSFAIDQDLSAQLLDLSHQQGTTLYMVLLAAFKVLLFRYSGQEDICVGTGIAGRQQQELEGLIGFFVNTLALRSEVHGDTSFTTLLQSVKTTTLDAYKHQEIPFEKVVDLTVKERDLSRNPLIQALFILQNTPDVPELKLGHLSVSTEGKEHDTSKFDIACFISETNSGLKGAIEYATDLYKGETIERMISHYKVLLHSIVSNPGAQTGKLAMLDHAEETTLLHEFNNTATEYPAGKSIITLFREQAIKNPDAIAIVFGEIQLTYKELNERSNQLAHYLVKQGVKPETLVPICLGRSLDMMIAILGVLKAGGAYVPIDPDYPQDRIGYMLTDTAAQLVLSSSNREKLTVSTASVIDMNGDWEEVRSQSVEDLLFEAAPNNLAYVIYTSGSTGRPKGVMIEHRSVVSLVKGVSYVTPGKDDVVLVTGSPSFDATTFEYWSMLLNGGRLILCSLDELLDSEKLKTNINKQKVTIMWFTSSWFNQLADGSPEVFSGLKTILVGGEKLSEYHIEKIRGLYPELKLINGYGPTENTTFSLTYAIDKVKNPIPIGKPLSNRTAYILTASGQLSPIGGTGEIYLGGTGIARGYLNNPELTAEKFITDEFSKEAGAKLYRTGDLGRWLPDGNIEYQGRIDDQVKIRGFRIELGEIENVLSQTDQVNQAVVLVKEDGPGGKRLLTYYVPDWQLVKAEENLLHQQHVATWKELYEVEYEKTEGATGVDEEFNIIGWNDSFTGLAISGDKMREWLDDIVNLILSENTGHVLEIGSGTGLIFYQLAGKVEKYLGTDLSRSSINQITARVNKGLRDYGPIDLWVSPAHEVSLPKGEQVDTIILNSIVQYFPGESYMDEVIKRSVSILNGNGRIIIGDVRDNRLLPMFKARLLMKKLQSTANMQELNWAVQQEVLKEEELCFSPEYFYRLKSLYPQITNVSIDWKHGSYINELTLYRYNVVIHVGVDKPIAAPEWKNWQQINKQEIVDQLNTGCEVLAIKDAPNPRLWKEKLINNVLQQKTTNSISDLSSIIENEDEETLEIREILAAAEANGYQYRLLLDEDMFKVNVLIEKTANAGFIQGIYSENSHSQIEAYANIPLFADISSILKKDIRSFLQQNLPDYMIPQDFIAVRQLPLTGNGKVDRRFLSQREETTISSASNYQPASTSVEQKLVNIWKELLSVERIGINDNFFDLGGHSLLAMRLVSAIRKQMEIEIAVKEIFNNPTIASLSGHLEGQNRGPLLPAIVQEIRPEHIPLSFSQERLWFIHNLEGSVQYHMPAVIRLKGRLNSEALENTLRDIISRHEVLRTVIREQGGLGYQHIIPGDNWALGITEDLVGAEGSDELSSYLSKLISKPFDLSQDYMLRADLIKLNSDDHLLVINMHHIASDGWSISILVKEVVEIYSAYTENRESQLPNLPVQYADFAIWQQKYLHGDVLEEKMTYWKTKLGGISPLELPTDYSRPAIQSSRGAKHFFKIEAGLSAQLHALSNQQGATLYMTLLAAFKILLYRYSGQEDICVGTPVAGRSQSELEGLIGFFVNTLALRSHISGDTSFFGLLQQVKGTTLDAYAHQEVPFEKVVDAVIKHRDMSRNPLFQVVFSLQNTPEVQEVHLSDLRLSTEAANHTTSKFDMTFLLREVSSGIQGVVEYATDLYTEESIERMVSHYVNLLSSIVVSADGVISNLTMLSKAEEQTLLTEFNDTAAEYPTEKTIVSLITEQVAKTPQRTAVAFGEEQLSYKQLNERSNQLARYLQKNGVKQETLVPICLERSLEMIVGILGILKAGGVYVPIDPDYPEERISYMLEDTAAQLVLSSKESEGRLSLSSIPIIRIDADRDKIDKESELNLDEKIRPDQLAYIIYTSGSTGKPKGVMIEHYNVVRLFKTEPHLYDFNENDVWTMFHSFCFDFSVWEMYGALFYGGKVIVVPKNVTRDTQLFSELIQKEQVTVLNQTPSAFYNLQDTFEEGNITATTIRYVIFGGEALNPGKLQYWKTTYENSQLVNMYGITETTVHVTYREIEWQHIQGGQSIIGKPIPTLSVYILNQDKSLVPIGVAGELYIGGSGLARGYLNRPELSSERFISNPFSKEPGARLYKTGDLGRWIADGNIEYLGRIDDQVKIRGYRIELGEIESVLNELDAVSQGVVLARGDVGNKRLVGYVVPTGRFDKQKIQEYLMSKLPDYMVPALWVELTSIPLTSNGKVDKKALPDPEITDLSAEYVAPRNETEAKLAEIWQSLLNIERVGINDNFFDLGGHSLLAMRVVSAIRRDLNVELSIRDLFVHSNIADLGAHLDEQTTGSLLPALIVGERPKYIPLSFSQERLWFIDSLEGSVQYHIPAVIRLKGTLNIAALDKTLRTILERHEVLRTVILEHDGQGYQHVMPADNWTLGVTEELSYKVATTGLSKYIAGLISAPFDLSGDYMLRADILKLGKDDYMLVVTMHHIASDGWSKSILVKEVIALYEGYTGTTEIKLPALEVQYADYAIWQRNWLQGDVLEEKLAYWKEKLEDVAPLQLPVDYGRPAIQSSRGAMRTFKIDKDLTTSLNDLGRQHGATLYMTLLAAFNILLHRYSNQEDICVGTPIAGRSQHEVEGLIGFFINTLALRSQVTGDITFNALLNEVKNTTLEAYAHQEVPYEKIVDAVVKARDMGRSPLFQVLFVLQNTPDVPELTIGGLSLSTEIQEHTTTQFDVSFLLSETSNGIHGTVEYATDLYKEETIERMMGHYVRLLESIVSSPAEQAGRLGMLDAAEEKTLLIEFNDTAAVYPKEKSVVSLFEEQAAGNPQATAIVFEDTNLSYAELNERANQLAHYLQKQGVTAEMLVPICIERGPDMVTGILGILKAGGTYVPVDPEYPQDRISYMLEDTGAKLVLSSKASRSKVSENQNIQIIELDSDWETIGKEEGSNPEAGIQPGQLAYVIYTSGSTGKPKGVMIEHKSLVNLLTGISKDVEFTTASSFLSVTTYSFDICYLELYVPLIHGSRLVIVSRETASDGFMLADSISANRPTHMQGTPSTWQLLSDAGWRNKEHIKMLIGGEAVKEGIKEYLTKIGHVWNVYGPTETTIWSTVKKLKSGEKVTIGKPIANTQVYIINGDKTLSPVGIPGEICIGGDGLARGYLNKPELTQEKFIKDPFSKQANARLYKTGDLGRWLPDGNLEHLGRIDDQVKIRGYRIELGEIESILNTNEQVKAGAVLAKEDSSGNKRLVGYVVPNGTFDKQAIQTQLSAKLPDYMVPGIWVELSTMPLTPNGKINRKALPDPEITDRSAEYVAPRNETEQALAVIWQRLLGLKRVGIHDNFFELGGHSLLAMRVAASIRKKLSVELNIRDLFIHPSIAELSAYLKVNNKSKLRSLTPIKPSGSKTPLYIICGAGGTVYKFREFANLLDRDQPVYGLQQFTDNRDTEEFPDTMQGIAARYIEDILLENPDGPYALAGHCLGGTIAFEMANQLEAMGKSVSLLAMFDASVKEQREIIRPSLSNLYHIPAKIRKIISAIPAKVKFELFLLTKHPKQALQYKIRKVKPLFGNNQESRPENMEQAVFDKLTKKLETALNNYQLDKYDGDILLFTAMQKYFFVDTANKIIYKEQHVNYDNKSAWKKHARSVKTYEVQGEHSTIFEAVNAKEFSRILQQHLDESSVQEKDSANAYSDDILLKGAS